MKTIKIFDATYDTMTLYRKANTCAQQALAGYIIKAGKINDPIFGGAFGLIRSIEHCNETGEIYKLYSLVDDQTERQIIHVAQLALDGKLDKFTISKTECDRIVKYLNESF